jgi:hypothetical protein
MKKFISDHIETALDEIESIFCFIEHISSLSSFCEDSD